MPAQEGRSPHPQSGPCGHTRGLLEERDAHCGGQHRHSMPKPGGCLAESLCPSAQEHETSSGGLDRTRPTTDECADMGPHAGETCLSLLHCSARIRVWKPKRVPVWLLNLQQIFFLFFWKPSHFGVQWSLFVSGRRFCHRVVIFGKGCVENINF